MDRGMHLFSRYFKSDISANGLASRIMILLSLTVSFFSSAKEGAEAGKLWDGEG
jgi:hypothetical protein